MLQSAMYDENLDANDTAESRPGRGKDVLGRMRRRGRKMLKKMERSANEPSSAPMEIGGPTDFKVVAHIGFDGASNVPPSWLPLLQSAGDVQFTFAGFDGSNNVPPAWLPLLQSAGLTQKDLFADPVLAQQVTHLMSAELGGAAAAAAPPPHDQSFAPPPFHPEHVHHQQVDRTTTFPTPALGGGNEHLPHGAQWTSGMPPSTSGMPPSTSGMPPSTNGMPPSTNGMPPSTNGMPPSTNDGMTPHSAMASSSSASLESAASPMAPTVTNRPPPLTPSRPPPAIPKRPVRVPKSPPKPTFSLPPKPPRNKSPFLAATDGEYATRLTPPPSPMMLGGSTDSPTPPQTNQSTQKPSRKKAPFLAAADGEDVTRLTPPQSPIMLGRSTNSQTQTNHVEPQKGAVVSAVVSPATSTSSQPTGRPHDGEQVPQRTRPLGPPAPPLMRLPKSKALVKPGPMVIAVSKTPDFRPSVLPPLAAQEASPNSRPANLPPRSASKTPNFRPSNLPPPPLRRRVPRQSNSQDFMKNATTRFGDNLPHLALSSTTQAHAPPGSLRDTGTIRGLIDAAAARGDFETCIALQKELSAASAESSSQQDGALVPPAVPTAALKPPAPPTAALPHPSVPSRRAPATPPHPRPRPARTMTSRPARPAVPSRRPARTMPPRSKTSTPTAPPPVPPALPTEALVHLASSAVPNMASSTAPLVKHSMTPPPVPSMVPPCTPPMQSPSPGSLPTMPNPPAPPMPAPPAPPMPSPPAPPRAATATAMPPASGATPNVAASGGSRGDLLASIRAGSKLRRVSTTPAPVNTLPRETAQPNTSLQAKLAMIVHMRRQQLQDEPHDSYSDDDDDEDEWSDS